MAEPLEQTLKRLEAEREEADRRYNEALTAVDRALPPPVGGVAPLPALDGSQLAALNEAWNTLPAPPGSGLKGRLAAIVWRIVGPALQRQLTFNSLLVDHLNRNAEAERASHAAREQAAAALKAQFDALASFHSRLVMLLQQITPYVDTRDRKAASGGLVLNTALSGVAERADMRWESLDARVEARMKTLAADQEALRSMAAVSQQAAQTLKRELERLLEAAPRPKASSPASGGPSTGSDAFAHALDAYKYVGFEDRFRGSREKIRERFESYLPLFTGASDVLDVGCGRGEFIELLSEAGVTARGIDLNHEMAEACRARGLDVQEADAVSHLTSLADGSLGGLFAAQVVEHLQPSYLLRFLDLAFAKLRPDGVMVLETLNPACWVAFFDSYIRDITHVWPLHPDTLQYLVLASGFTRADVEYRSPVPPEHRLQTVAVAEDQPAALLAVADAFNENVHKLNRRMFTDLDYAIHARKGR